MVSICHPVLRVKRSVIGYLGHGHGFRPNATVLAEGQWVTFSECLKLFSQQLRLVSGNSWALWKCLSQKNKKSKPIRSYHIYSQNGPDFGQDATVWPEGQWVNTKYGLKINWSWTTNGLRQLLNNFHLKECLSEKFAPPEPREILSQNWSARRSA